MLHFSLLSFKNSWHNYARKPDVRVLEVKREQSIAVKCPRWRQKSRTPLSVLSSRNYLLARTTRRFFYFSSMSPFGGGTPRAQEKTHFFVSTRRILRSRCNELERRAFIWRDSSTLGALKVRRQRNAPCQVWPSQCTCWRSRLSLILLFVNLFPLQVQVHFLH